MAKEFFADEVVDDNIKRANERDAAKFLELKHEKMQEQVARREVLSKVVQIYKQEKDTFNEKYRLF